MIPILILHFARIKQNTASIESRIVKSNYMGKYQTTLGKGGCHED